jgi:hypothetical protein
MCRRMLKAIRLIEKSHLEGGWKTSPACFEQAYQSDSARGLPSPGGQLAKYNELSDKPSNPWLSNGQVQ